MIYRLVGRSPRDASVAKNRDIPARTVALWQALDREVRSSTSRVSPLSFGDVTVDVSAGG
jgi:hypothetical protein